MISNQTEYCIYNKELLNSSYFVTVIVIKSETSHNY